MNVIERMLDDVLALNEYGPDPAELADDGTDWKGKVVEKPWGHEQEVYRAGAVSIWRLVLNKGSETSMHAHPNKDTMLLVESGVCVLETLNALIPLYAGSSVHIKPGAFHRTMTEGGAVLIEIETPANKRDLVRIDDRYGRKGQGY